MVAVLCVLEDAAADEDAVAAQLHHEGGVSGGRHAAGGEVDDGQAAQLGRLLEQGHVAAKLAGQGGNGQVAALGEGGLGAGDAGVDGADVLDGLDDVAGAGLALGADHGGALLDAAQGLAQVTAAADEGHLEVGLGHVELVVGGRQHLALVDKVDAERLEDLALDHVPDARLGHDGYRHGGPDLLDHLRVRHARHAAHLADVGRDPLQRHDRHGARLLGDARLLRRRHVHDDAALEHLGEPGLDGEVVAAGAIGSGGGGGGVRVGCHFFWTE